MRILCIGDSNTWGYKSGEGTRIEKRWTKVLAEKLKDDEVIEEGLSGRTFITQDFEAKERCGADSLKMLLETHAPIDLVIIMLGTNDLKKTYHFGANAIANGIKTYLGILKNPYVYDVYGVPKVMFISPVLIGEQIVDRQGEYGEFDENSLIQSKQLGKAMKTVCDQCKVLFMAAEDYAKASCVDELHMDDMNHIALANAIFEKVEKIKS